MNKDPPTQQELSMIAELVAENVVKLLREENLISQEYLNTKAAAKFLGLSAQRLEIWRSRGEGPPYAKISQAVRYKRSDLQDFMRSKTKFNKNNNGVNYEQNRNK